MKFSILLTIFLAAFADSTHAANYRLPFNGQWFVMQGGDTPNVNHHMHPAIASQWYGVDFVKTGGPKDRAVTKDTGQKLQDSFSWGQPIVSPVAGVVRTALDGLPDNPIGMRDRKKPFGNHVVIEAGLKEFVYLAHFQKGSVAVK